MFTYPCPNCALRLNAPPERAGQRTMCPKCFRPIVIPSPDQVGQMDADADANLPSSNDRADAPPVPLTPSPMALQKVVGSGAMTVARKAPDSGKIVFSSSAMTPMDIAGELSAAISMRMKPPPDPRADLRLSTGVWLLLTVGGAVLWLVGIAYESDAIPFVALIGCLQAALGYLWSAYLVGTHNRTRGLLTLLPPIGIFRLFRPFGENGYRPLRFVLSGLLIVAAWTVADKVKGETRSWLATLTAPPSENVAPVIAPADKLRATIERNQPELLVAQLNSFAHPEALAETAESDRPEVVAELAKLLKADLTEVRSAALMAMAVWSPDAARGPTLQSLKSTDSGERKTALGLAARWPDAEMATAVAGRLADRQEQHAAQEVLTAMGGPVAEVAILPLLKSDDLLFVLFVLDLVEKLGGATTVDALKELSLTGKSSKIREEAGKVADAMAAKINPKK